MENSPEPLAKKLLEKVRIRQEEMDSYDSPVRCPVNTRRTSSLDKENKMPLDQKNCTKDDLTSVDLPKTNKFAVIAEAYNNFEYEFCHAPRNKKDYLVNISKNTESSFEIIGSNDEEEEFFFVKNNLDELPPQLNKLENISKVKNNEILSVERDFTQISVADTKDVVNESEKKLNGSNENTITKFSPIITNRKAMDIAKEFDSTSRNFRTACKQSAVKYIDGKVAVKSLRPGALSPTLLYGNRRKVDMKNSEVVIPEIASVKNLKSKWEENIISGAKIENDDKEVPQDNFLDEKELLNECISDNGNSLPEISKSDKCEFEKGHEDEIINDVFNFVHLEESSIPSPIFDCKTPKNLMEDINTELNKFSTPRNRLNERRQFQTDLPIDSPKRQLVHSISFYRKKAKEIEEVVKHNIDLASSDVISSAGYSGISNGSHNNEDICEDFVDIEAKIKKLKEGIHVQQDQIAQASRAILYCRENDIFKGSREEVDAQRALLIAHEKKKVLSMEYEKIKTCGANSFSRDPRGTLTITNIIIKLSKEFVNVHINQKTDPYIYYFIVLLKIADKILYTQLISSDTGIKNGYVEFSVQINLKNIPADFVALLEIFCLRSKKDSKHGKDTKSKTFTPFKKFSYSTPSSSSRQLKSSSNNIINPSFHKIGGLSFNISHINKKNFTLKEVKQPLDGTIRISMNCTPEKESVMKYKGFLNLYQFVGDLSSWNRYWCVLKGSNMIFWKYPEEEDKKQPAIIIDLESVKGKVEHINDESACFPNTMQLFVEVLDKEKLSTIRILFAADTLPQMESWLTYINGAINCIFLWSSKNIPSNK